MNENMFNSSCFSKLLRNGVHCDINSSNIDVKYIGRVWAWFHLGMVSGILVHPLGD